MLIWGLLGHQFSARPIKKGILFPWNLSCSSTFSYHGQWYENVGQQNCGVFVVLIRRHCQLSCSRRQGMRQRACPLLWRPTWPVLSSPRHLPPCQGIRRTVGSLYVRTGKACIGSLTDGMLARVRGPQIGIWLIGLCDAKHYKQSMSLQLYILYWRMGFQCQQASSQFLELLV